MIRRTNLSLSLLLLLVSSILSTVVQSLQLGYCQLGCYKDSDCMDGLQCSLAHASELQALGYSSTKADCYVRSTFIDEFNDAGVCYTFNKEEKKKAGGFGDPHFTTWDGTHYTFHGSCDLIMATSNQFGHNATSLDVHIRTDTVSSDASWSLISNAAVQIGNDIIIELSNDGIHSVNRIENFDLPYTFHMNNQTYVVQRTEEIVEQTGDVRTFLRIENQDTVEHIQLNLYKKMISVHIDAKIPDTYGMLGYYHTPGMIGRNDPTIVLQDANVMGMSWQVRDTDPFLFRTRNGPQYPEQCRMPPTSALSQQRRRLLRQSQQQRYDAEQACSRIVDPTVRQFCIDDVLITGDITVAYVYRTSSSVSSSGFAF